MENLLDGWKAEVDFEILRRLNGGGGGEIYDALMRCPDGVNPRVVVKIALPNDKAAVDSLRDEAHLLTRLAGHRNIIGMRLYGKHTMSGVSRPVLVLDHGGISLLQLLQANGGRLEPGLAIFIALEICAGLAHAHSNGIIHRDIKPGNIMVGRYGDVKLIDLGIAKADDRFQMTTNGQVKGTPSYLAPEAIQCEPLDGRADLWAVGVLLYEMLMGRPPWVPKKGSGKDDAWKLDLATRILTEPAPPMPLEQVSETLAAVVMRLLSKDRDKRYSDATETIHALNKIRGLSAHIALAELGQQVRAAEDRLTRVLSPQSSSITVPIDADKRAAASMVAVPFPDSSIQVAMSGEFSLQSDSGHALAVARKSDRHAVPKMDLETTDALPALPSRRGVPRAAAMGFAIAAMMVGGVLAVRSSPSAGDRTVAVLPAASAGDSQKQHPAKRVPAVAPPTAPTRRAPSAPPPVHGPDEAQAGALPLGASSRRVPGSAEQVGSPSADSRAPAPSLLAPAPASAQQGPAPMRRAGAPSPAKAATLTVLLAPPGGFVSLDGRKPMRAPAEFAELRPGRHIVRAGVTPANLNAEEKVKLVPGANELRIVIPAASLTDNPFEQK
jgi:serine/threonine-protein kinase